jgi:hypothetical protein
MRFIFFDLSFSRFSSGVNCPKYAGASGARNAFQAGGFALNALHRQPGECRRFDLKRG